MPVKKKDQKGSSVARTLEADVWLGDGWSVRYGELRTKVRRQKKKDHLFKALGEKLPWDSLSTIKRHLLEEGHGMAGIYIAHDSMGTPRYIGRGNIFNRLRRHKRNYSRELTYFSFYIVADKTHEREIETLMIRSAGPLLEFNTSKKRIGIEAGAVRDYESGTYFYQRRNRMSAQ